MRIELYFSFGSPRHLEEWKASDRIEHDERFFHVEKLEEQLQQKENWWRIATHGHEQEQTMKDWPNEINH